MAARSFAISACHGAIKGYFETIDEAAGRGRAGWLVTRGGFAGAAAAFRTDSGGGVLFPVVHRGDYQFRYFQAFCDVWTAIRWPWVCSNICTKGYLAGNLPRAAVLSASFLSPRCSCWRNVDVKLTAGCERLSFIQYLPGSEGKRTYPQHVITTYGRIFGGALRARFLCVIDGG